MGGSHAAHANPDSTVSVISDSFSLAPRTTVKYIIKHYRNASAAEGVTDLTPPI